MKFGFTVSQGLIGNNIDLQIRAEGDQLIQSVETELDNFVLANDDIIPESVHVERSFRQVGTWSPNQSHRLVVRVLDQNGDEEVATKIFING